MFGGTPRSGAATCCQREPEAKGWHGLGFRFTDPKNESALGARAGLTAQPGRIDGVSEGLCPPYVNSMDEAVDLVIEEKYGPDGHFPGPRTLARAYQRAEDAETYIKLAQSAPPASNPLHQRFCNYIYDTYGRFPAHVDAFHRPGFWVQCHHLETDYYERSSIPNSGATRPRTMKDGATVEPDGGSP